MKVGKYTNTNFIPSREIHNRQYVVSIYTIYVPSTHLCEYKTSMTEGIYVDLIYLKITIMPSLYKVHV